MIRKILWTGLPGALVAAGLVLGLQAMARGPTPALAALGTTDGGTATTVVALESSAAQVTIQNYAFTPASIRVPAGTTVTWINRDPIGHTATARDNTWGSTVLGTGAQYSYTFAREGSYSYYCLPHPWMIGTVLVGDAATPPAQAPETTAPTGDWMRQLHESIHGPGTYDAMRGWMDQTFGSGAFDTMRQWMDQGTGPGSVDTMRQWMDQAMGAGSFDAMRGQTPAPGQAPVPVPAPAPGGPMGGGMMGGGPGWAGPGGMIGAGPGGWFRGMMGR